MTSISNLQVLPKQQPRGGRRSNSSHSACSHTSRSVEESSSLFVFDNTNDWDEITRTFLNDELESNAAVNATITNQSSCDEDSFTDDEMDNFSQALDCAETVDAPKCRAAATQVVPVFVQSKYCFCRQNNSKCLHCFSHMSCCYFLMNRIVLLHQKGSYQ